MTDAERAALEAFHKNLASALYALVMTANKVNESAVEGLPGVDRLDHAEGLLSGLISVVGLFAKEQVKNSLDNLEFFGMKEKEEATDEAPH